MCRNSDLIDACCSILWNCMVWEFGNSDTTFFTTMVYAWQSVTCLLMNDSFSPLLILVYQQILLISLIYSRVLLVIFLSLSVIKRDLPFPFLGLSFQQTDQLFTTSCSFFFQSWAIVHLHYLNHLNCYNLTKFCVMLH